MEKGRYRGWTPTLPNGQLTSVQVWLCVSLNAIGLVLLLIAVGLGWRETAAWVLGWTTVGLIVGGSILARWWRYLDRRHCESPQRPRRKFRSAS
jgi:hypothetical protein